MMRAASFLRLSPLLLLAAALVALAVFFAPGAQPAQAQDEESPPPVANLKCEAKTDQVRFSWDIPQWSGGEIKAYDVVVTLPNGNQFTERRHWMLRSRTDRGNWQPGSGARIAVKALYDLPNGDRVTSAASEAACVVPGTPNSAPAVSSAIADATIVNESGTHQVTLTGVFSDADNDALTITASSSDDTVATATVSAEGSTLTVEAKSRGTATITVRAADGKGGTVDDVFTVTVKAAPVVASPIADVSGLEVGSTRDVSLSGVFSDADDDAVTITAASSDGAKATVSVAANYVRLTVSGVAEGSASVTVRARDSDGNTVDDVFDVTVNAAAQQQQDNRAPTVSAALGDASIVNESGTRQVSLSGVFADADEDQLTITAGSSGETIATVTVAADHSSLTVNARDRGTATITVTADDGNGGTVSDTFTVTVKAAPTVAAPIADLSGLEAGATQDVSLSGVFRDADGDSLTVTAASSDEGKATVAVASDGSKLTVTAQAVGTATITATARDADGNTVQDAFEVVVVKKYAALIARVYQWRNDPNGVNNKSHTDRWDRALLALGETVADGSLTPMTAAEAQGFADRGWTRWNPVAEALREIQGEGQQQQANQAPTVSSAIGDVTIVSETGTRQLSLSGVFDDGDGDALTIIATSSDEAAATVSVASDGSSLTVSAEARGTATITVTADDGNGGSVDDTFTVTVKAAPVVASAIADVSELAVDATHQVSMSGVFSDADGDAVTVTQASSSDTSIAAVTAAIEGLTAAITAVTVTGKSEGTATITVTAQDADGNTVSDAFDVTVPAAAVQLQRTQSSDATLSALTLTKFSGAQDPTPPVALRPAFASGTTEYAASAPAFTALVRVTATASDPGATIRVDGQAVASGAFSQAIRLVDNQPKRIAVTVTAADGTTQQTYAVAATLEPRADLRDLTLSPGELHPSIFVTVQQDYRAWTPHSVASVRVTATRRHGAETLTVNGQAVTSGQPSPAIDLEVGENLITVVATAPDGYTSKSYTITVTRLTEAQSSDATLSDIKVYQATSFQPDNANNVPYEGDPLTITPAISRMEREYLAEQPEADGIYVAVVVTTNAPGARSIVIDGPDVNLERRDPKDEVVSGEASGPWQMSIGYQLITIKVTSLDGKNTETYRLVIKRGMVDDLKGLRLSSGDGSLTLSWEASDSPTAPTEYMLRWRKAGETAWLNRGFPPGWKTSYALDAGYAGPADGDRFAALSQGSATVSGLENGVAYEVQARGGRGPLNPATGERQVFVFLRTDWQSLTGTPGAAKTTLTITPSSPSRQYGGADDLGYTVSGLKSGDAVTDVLTGALSRAAGEDAGDYAIGMGTLAVASAHADKYALPAAPSVTTYTITPRPVTAISGVTVNARASDGTTDATFDTSASAGTGVLPAELADFRAGGLQVSGAFPVATAGTRSLSVTYALQDYGSFKSANYRLTAASDTLPGEITDGADTDCPCKYGLMLFADGVPAEGGGPVTVVAGLRDPAGPEGVSVTLTTGGTATGDDYSLSANIINIAPGATAGLGTITVTDDALDDDGETIVLNAALSGSSLTAGPLTLTIADNDDPATPAPTPVAAAGCPVPAGGDYDADDDGLIEVSCLAQLNTIRWDVDGDGSATDAGYAVAFSNAATGMGCPQTGCIGYELTADLDFDTNDNGVADAGDTYWNSGQGWTPIGFGAGIVRSVPVPPFEAVFDGNGHTISNLHIKLHTVISTTSISHGYIGLFSYTGSDAVIRNVGLESVDVSPTGRGALGIGGLVGINEGTISNSHVTGVVSSYFNNVGGLAGYNIGAISASYATASVTGGAHTGGLVGWNHGGIYASYATGNVSGKGMVGGLVGNQMSGGATVLHSGGTTGEIVASYATGNVSGYNTVGGLAGNAAGTITASYSLGTVSATYDGSVPSVERRVGGLVGNCVYSCHSSDDDSYWNTQTSGRTSSPHGIGKTTAELQSPTGYAGIYADWNVDLDGDGSDDDPWDFGTSCQYPVLKYGILNPDAQRSPCVEDTTTNQPAGNTDYDVDDDRLIEVSNLAQLNAIRWDLDGDGSASDAGYAAAYPNAASGMGCPSSRCIGYELAVDLYFDTNSSDKADAGDEYWNGGAGWTPIGDGSGGFAAAFEGRLRNINGLYINSPGDDVGLFGSIATSGIVRNVLLEDFHVSGGSRVGALAGRNSGTVISGWARGGDVWGVGAVGGLIGLNDSSSVVKYSFVGANVAWDSSGAVNVTGTTPRSGGGRDVGGLVGANYGDILASRAYAQVSGQANNTGGLVGFGEAGSSIVAANARISVSSSGSYIGGLVGSSWGDITASYATASVSGGSNMGGLVGYHGSGSVTDSYWDTETSGQATSAAGTGKTTAELKATTGTGSADYTGIYANWNVDLDGDGNADDPWDFGTASSYPIVSHHAVSTWLPGQLDPLNRAPTVSAALGDATIVSESGTRQVSLSGVFADADGDELTITAASSDESRATVSVASDGSSLTVSAEARGTATITVTADDGNGGSVDDTFTVTVKAAPVVASAIADVSGLEAGASRDVSLSGVFSDADGDSLTVTASSSDEGKATVTVSADGSRLTVAGVSAGTATITATAQDADGNTVQDAFEVSVVKRYAALISQMYQWRNDPQWVSEKAHTDRWDRALLALGETVADGSLTPMTAAEAQGFADRGWTRWVEVAKALLEIEAG